MEKMLGTFVSDFQNARETGEYEPYIRDLLQSYENLGPLPGLLLPFIESFLPFLPLFVFVFANATAYGLLKGFLYSWIGSSMGSIVVFLIIRKFNDKRILKKVRTNKQVHKVTKWVDTHGFGPLFLLLCFPFSPTAIINIVAGLSNIRIQQFILAVLLGKAVMIFSIAYVGDSIMSFAQNPTKTIIVAVCITLFWIVGKYVEKRLQKRNENKVKE